MASPDALSPADRGGGSGAQETDRLGSASGFPPATPTAGLIRGLPGCEVFGDPGLAAFIRERIQELARGAHAAQGRRAFESTLRAAALHESGHAVVYSALGVPLTRLAVRRRQGHWVGRTSTAAGPWRCDADSAPLADLDCATGLMAGVVSELLFDDDFRHGSSIDEVALFHAISENIAIKTGADFVRVQVGIVVRTENILRRNREIVLRIAQRLEWHRTLWRREIVELLAGVAEAAPSGSMSVDTGIADIDCPPREGGPA